MKFVDWDHRPAVLIDGKAYAVLGPRDPRCMVDSLDVAHTARVMTEAAWRKEFEGPFGSLDLSLIARARREHIQFVNWSQRPAVMVRGKAFAVSSAPPWMWTSVDPSAVIATGIFMSERAWRRMFMGKFGRLKLFRQENRPTDKEFDDGRGGSTPPIWNRSQPSMGCRVSWHLFCHARCKRSPRMSATGT
jgi:hypothetical protein